MPEAEDEAEHEELDDVIARVDRPEAEAALLAGEKPGIVAAAHPSASVAWAALAEEALAEDKAITAYAYARTGYHRGLDQLRRNAHWFAQPLPAGLWTALRDAGRLDPAAPVPSTSSSV